MEEAPVIQLPIAAITEWEPALSSARDLLVTDCLRAFHASKPRLPRVASSNFEAWQRLTSAELEKYFLLLEVLTQQFAESPSAQRRLLRALLTIYLPPLSEKTLSLADEILLCERTPTPIESLTLPRLASKVAVWRGDITLLRIDAIVNAANSQMLGCFTPEHKCIDNVIHARSGPRLRVACADQMQGQEEPTGSCRVTPGYCLHSRFVLHTVGPIIGYDDVLRPVDLANCYKSCLEAAVNNGIHSVAFCCISTGVFRYPQEAAAHVALHTVAEWLTLPQAAKMDLVLFDVFLAEDAAIYARLAPTYFPPPSAIEQSPTHS